MSLALHNAVLVANRNLRADPTRTIVLRNAFASDVSSRLRMIKKLINEAVVEQDVFGLTNEPNQPQVLVAPARKAFQFKTTAEKHDAFMRWLHTENNKHVLQISEGAARTAAGRVPWANVYIDSAYKRGMKRADDEMAKKGIAPPKHPADVFRGPIDARFNQPFHADRVAQIYTRVYSDLKGITDDMESLISHRLAEGLAEGRHPRQIAQILNKTIEASGESLAMVDTIGRKLPSITRARIIARTEVIRAHHVATINTYREANVVGVRVKAEWSTAGDDRVCEECASLEEQIFTLDQIEMLIPRHPQCRCVALPVSPEEMAMRAPEEGVVPEVPKDIMDVPVMGRPVEKFTPDVPGLPNVYTLDDWKQVQTLFGRESRMLSQDISVWEVAYPGQNFVGGFTDLAYAQKMGSVKKVIVKKGTYVSKLTPNAPNAQMQLLYREPGAVIKTVPKIPTVARKPVPTIPEPPVDPFRLRSRMAEKRNPWRKDINAARTKQDLRKVLQKYDVISETGHFIPEQFDSFLRMKKAVYDVVSEHQDMLKRSPGLQGIIGKKKVRKLHILDRHSLDVSTRMDRTYHASGLFDDDNNFIHLCTRAGPGAHKKYPGGSPLELGGDSVSGWSTRAVYRHELSHRIDVYRFKTSSRWEGIWGYDRIMTKNVIDKTKTVVSEYARTAPHEAGAEVLSAYLHPNYGKPGMSRLPTVLEKYCKILLNPKTKYKDFWDAEYYRQVGIPMPKNRKTLPWEGKP